MSNPISEALGNPMARMAGEAALKGATDYVGNIGIKEYAGRIFTPELKAYFDVDTQLVKHKLIKLLAPFRSFEFDDQIKRLELYLPIVSLMTLIMFSTLLEGLQSEKFNPSIMRRAVWLLVLTSLEVMGAKMTENAISNLNIGVFQLISLVSYRFVSLSVVTIILVVTVSFMPPLRYLGVFYALIVDTYYCKLQLSNCSRQRFKEEGMGNYIVLGVHVFVTLVIMWLCGIL